MRTKRCLFLGVLMGWFVVCPALADVRLPAIFGDGMVLQQRSSATVWGWAEPGERITVIGSWQWLFGTSTTADAEGNWRVQINTPRAGGPHTLTVRGNNEIVLEDVLIGEVWLCSGQSNMEWSFNHLRSYEKAQRTVQAANYPDIRLFTVKKETAATPQIDCTGQWQVSTPESIVPFSAVAFYFGRALHEKLDVPIGLIHSSWGGTPAEAWTSAEALRAHGDFDTVLNRIQDPEAYQQAAEQRFKQDMVQWEESLAEMDKGAQDNWHHPGFDDGQWSTIELPGSWSGTELEGTEGIVWFRRRTNLPPSWARSELELRLGRIEDVATVWVNGVKVDPVDPGTYRLPAPLLRVGPNVIAVRVVNLQGEAGFFAEQEDDMRIGSPGADADAAATVARTWTYNIGYRGAVPPPPALPGDVQINHRSPSVLFNAMISPLVGFRIAGVIWYQGESNRYRAAQYRTLFPAMIRNWQNVWQQGNFPFYFVQIAPYKYRNPDDDPSARLREAQLQTLEAVPNVGMAVTMDIGEKDDIHPHNKHDVGRRLSLWALAKTYNRSDIVYSGPLYRAMKVRGDTAHITFDYVGSGLVAKDGPLRDFEIAGIDRTFVPAEAVIDDDNTVLVSSPQVPNPVAVRYAFKNWVEPNLFNAEGLPASSFRTDNWPAD